jgi:outer membrane protein OmpA-like peptidoglycan-associated protein
MKDYYISGYESNYNEVELALSPSGLQKMEGNLTTIHYRLKDNAQKPSPLQIIRNHTNAAKAKGGQVVFDGENDMIGRAAAIKFSQQGKEAIVQVQPGDDGYVYTLTILELSEMEQEVSSGGMLDTLNKDGHVAVNILFDTGKATIKPESQPLIDQIVDMMKANGDLKIRVEGHTDNVGNPLSNMGLSEGRAKAVVNALTAAGIAPDRLTSAGFGQDKPVADNGAEEGRAKNRRVELVKR